MDILLMLPGFILSLILTVVYARELRKSQNKVHFYVARDMNGELWLYMGKPIRGYAQFCSNWDKRIVALSRNFKPFGINKDDYAKLQWEDEPVEVFINMED